MRRTVATLIRFRPVLQLLCYLTDCRAKHSFSEALLPGSAGPGRLDGKKSLFEKFYERFSRSPSPEVAAQLTALEGFSPPELLQITKVSRTTFWSIRIKNRKIEQKPHI